MQNRLNPFDNDGMGIGMLTLFVRAYTTCMVFWYPIGFVLSIFVISAGLVVPGLFLRPLRLALTSSPLILISIWFGKAMSTLVYG